MTTFHYRDSRNEERTGSLRILSDNDPVEIEVQANGWTFHVLTGEHTYGRYICIPNWDIGTEFAGPDEMYWNNERLRSHTGLHPDNVAAVVSCKR